MTQPVLRSRLAPVTDGDRGAALVVVLLVMVVLTAIGVTMTNVAIANLNNAGRDRVGGKAFASAEAGIAHGIAHLRASGVNGLASSAWGTTGQTVDVGDGRQYVVTITAVTPLDIGNGVKVGTYLIRSVGTAGSGPGKQVVEETVSVRPFDFPLGIFTEQDLTASGQVPIFTESVLSRGCINDRDKLTFTGYDAAYKDPNGNPKRAAAHAVGYITTRNSCSANPLSDGQRIHPTASPKYCSPTYPYDQDALGGPLNDAGSSSYCDGLADQYVDYVDPLDPSAGVEKTSKFTFEKLQTIYGYRTGGLSDAQYAQLKNKAKGDGTYYEATGNTIQASSLALPCATAPCANGGPALQYPVLYFKVPSGSTVKFQNHDLPGYTYPTSDNPCPTLPSVIVIVEGGNLQFAGNPGITGSVFVPHGDFDFQAGTIVGTVYAKNLQLTGNSVMRLTSCSLKNMSGGLLTVTSERFHQDDD